MVKVVNVVSDKTVNIKCMDDDDFAYSRFVQHGCGNIISLNEDNVFTVLCVDYFGDTMVQYYTVCPKCGYMVMIDEKDLTPELKMSAYASMTKNPFQFKLNCLRSETIYWKNKNREAVKKKIKI